MEITPRSDENKTLTFDVRVNFLCEQIPEPLSIIFKQQTGFSYSVWAPNMGFDRHIGPNWGKRRVYSRLASWMPVYSVLKGSGKNALTVALSDAKTPLSIGCGYCEEDGCIDHEITLFTSIIAPVKEYSAVIRLDYRDIPFSDSVYDVTEWWETECGYKPACVPDTAKMPMDSLWYSYHQEIDVEETVKECKIAKSLGMETVIVDDGWQTDDNNRGYKYCGDWEVTPNKIPDMKDFVRRVHDTGMKIMLWYSVPFMGLGSKNYERFKDMLLYKTGNDRDHWSLDPRYKEVRDFLIGNYVRAVKEWGFDGLKLDFIDAFELKGESLKPDDRRDIYSLEDAVDRLMKEVLTALKEVNPDVMIEFRQSYVGPAIRQYGNILRVGDCPGDALSNRKGSVDLRLTSGKTAVHSDMMIWDESAPPEAAATQLIGSLYAVPQISVKLAYLPESHVKTIRAFLSFWLKYREVILGGRLKVTTPEAFYGSVTAEKEGVAVITAYSDRIIDLSGYREAAIVNGSSANELVIKNANGKSYEVVNCLGEKVNSGTVDGDCALVSVPITGIVYIKG